MEMSDSGDPIARVRAYLQRVADLQRRYLCGEIRVHVPEGLAEGAASLADGAAPLHRLIARTLPRSHAALQAASQSLFCALPIAFDPGQSVGPYLATLDRDPQGEPYRFLDMGALIATQAYGENDPGLVAAILGHLPYAVGRFAHSEYQTDLSLRLKAALNEIAPAGTPRHFVVNTGSEAVENAIKAVLLNRVRTTGQEAGEFIISFDGAFHGRTLGSLAATHRRKARLGFPTFNWPHVSFPTVEPARPRTTLRREARSLRQIWGLLVSGRQPRAQRSEEAFRQQLSAIDAFLADPAGDAVAFVAAQCAALSPAVRERSRRAAGLLVEPIQCEGGLRFASARFFQKLRLLTRIYDVPLVFDEVQTGWGATGWLWAHEQFQLPLPPDAVVWAKKAQNGVLFVSEELATFFQEERKFNTTWEGDSVGMVRLLSSLPRLDLEQVRCTGALARELLDDLAREHPQLLTNVRGQGVLLAFDVVRPDWRDALRERAFRLGLLLLPAGERTLRVYPRYDTQPGVLREAASLLRRAIADTLARRGGDEVARGPELRVGSIDCHLDCLEVVDISGASFPAHLPEVTAIEVERYGASDEAEGNPLDGLLQYPTATLQDTSAHPGSLGLALRDGVTGTLVAYALGSPLEQHGEEGVRADPHYGEENTLYLQAVATHPAVRNHLELEALMLDLVLERARSSGFSYLSTLIEERVPHTASPRWRRATVLRTVENYLGSGVRFAYLQLLLEDPTGEP